MNRSLRQLVKALEAQGFTTKVTKKGHVTVYGPDGAWVTTMAGTPSDHRSMRNAMAALRRAGYTG